MRRTHSARATSTCLPPSARKQREITKLMYEERKRSKQNAVHSRRFLVFCEFKRFGMKWPRGYSFAFLSSLSIWKEQLQRRDVELSLFVSVLQHLLQWFSFCVLPPHFTSVRCWNNREAITQGILLLTFPVNVTVCCSCFPVKSSQAFVYWIALLIWRTSSYDDFSLISYQVEKREKKKRKKNSDNEESEDEDENEDETQTSQSQQRTART